MWWCMSRMTFSPFSWHYKIFKLSYTTLFIFRPTLRKSCGIIISSFACFFMNNLHRQDFATLLIHVLLDTMQTCFRFYTGPIVVTWLLTRPTTPMFCLSWVHFLTTLHTCLDLPHPIIAHFFILLVWTYHRSFWYPNFPVCGNERIITHNTLQDTIATPCFVKWSTHTERGFPFFSLPHS
jgi:hypothetical protein